MINQNEVSKNKWKSRYLVKNRTINNNISPVSKKYLFKIQEKSLNSKHTSIMNNEIK